MGNIFWQGYHVNVKTPRDRQVSRFWGGLIMGIRLGFCAAIASIAVVDRAGRIKVLLQGDGGSPHNLELARRKAYTARTFRMPSAAWAKRTETTNQGQRMLSDVIPLGGGMPIMVGEE